MIQRVVDTDRTVYFKAAKPLPNIAASIDANGDVAFGTLLGGLDSVTTIKLTTKEELSTTIAVLLCAWQEMHE